MTSEIENYIALNCSWEKLPANIKKLLGNTKKEYEKQVVEYSIKTQQHYIGNLVQQIVSDQKVYYQDLVNHSRNHLMMFPYHLSEYVVRGLRITPFQYYIDILSDIMAAEKSYDSLPNFTAADCLRLLGIGRNQYIDLMNQCRSSRKLFRRKNIRELLPALPKEISIEPWWIVKAGCITEEDIKIVVSDKEKIIIDSLLDSGPQKAGSLEKESVHTLYASRSRANNPAAAFKIVTNFKMAEAPTNNQTTDKPQDFGGFTAEKGKGLIYLYVPIEDSDCLSVPPLEGFVMNRVLGDYLEILMYKIFVSIDEHTPVCELAKVLQIDLRLVKVAVSLFCRLGFAQRKTCADPQYELHPSWGLNEFMMRNKIVSPTTEDLLLQELESALAESVFEDGIFTPMSENARTPFDENFGEFGAPVNGAPTKRIAFLYDSTLTAFLMMGNLSQGLKSHAVTMFEVGKLLDESLDSLVVELDKIQRSDSEGEAQRYFEHALTLRTTIGFLRHNPDLIALGGDIPPALDLIRWESLSNLDPATTARLLNKNYQFLVSMAPLSYEIPNVDGEMPPHFGAPIPEANSIWFKLFLYHLTGSGPPSLLLPKGERLCRLPSMFGQYEKVLITPWGHEPTVVPLTAVFFTVNESLMHSPVFLQAYGWYHDAYVQHIPLPLDETSMWAGHKALQTLNKELNLKHTFGFLKLVAFPRINQGSSDTTGMFLGTSEIKTGVPRSFPSDVGIVKIPQVVSFDDVSNIGTCDTEVLVEGIGSSDGQLSSSTTVLPSIDQWMLLECHFGLPLFDAKLNDDVSRRVVTHKLFAAENVEKFMISSKELVEKLKAFVDECQAQTNPFTTAERKQMSDSASSLPLPTKSLLFENGTLTQWNGS